MSNLSQFFSGGGIPVGASIIILDAPARVVDGSAEFLRTGMIKSYDSSYAAAIAVAPQLRVFGNNASTYGATTGSSACRYAYIGGKYVAMQENSSKQGSSLNNISAYISPSFWNTASKKLAVGNGYLVCPQGANMPHKYTADGMTATIVGGTFSSAPASPSMCYCAGLGWLGLASLAGTANEMSYIANVVPTGSWTLTACAALTMTSCNAMAFGNGVIVAVGNSSLATTGKIATNTALPGVWVDRTASSGIVFSASERIVDVVFDGAKFIAVTDVLRIITSSNGVDWKDCGVALDNCIYNPITGATGASFAGNDFPNLCTDGAGTTVLTQGVKAVSRPVFAISVDHGATWAPAQVNISKAPLAAYQHTMSYVNGRWIFNGSADPQSLVDLGPSLNVEPDYIGQQAQLIAGQYVRIK